MEKHSPMQKGDGGFSDIGRAMAAKKMIFTKTIRREKIDNNKNNITINSDNNNFNIENHNNSKNNIIMLRTTKADVGPFSQTLIINFYFTGRLPRRKCKVLLWTCSF